MAFTIYETPILSPVLKHISHLGLKTFGWKLEGELPDLPKYVVITNHSSNWDFLITVLGSLALSAKVSIMMKSSLFRGPFNPFLKWLGGIPVNRSASSNFVDQMVKTFEEKKKMILMLAPEGTRDRVKRWKSGFYHIARGADVPVVLAFIDYVKKTTGVGPLVFPSGDFEADMAKIKTFYANITERYAEKFSKKS